EHNEAYHSLSHELNVLFLFLAYDTRWRCTWCCCRYRHEIELLLDVLLLLFLFPVFVVLVRLSNVDALRACRFRADDPSDCPESLRAIERTKSPIRRFDDRAQIVRLREHVGRAVFVIHEDIAA